MTPLDTWQRWASDPKLRQSIYNEALQKKVRDYVRTSKNVPKPLEKRLMYKLNFWIAFNLMDRIERYQRQMPLAEISRLEELYITHPHNGMVSKRAIILDAISEAMAAGWDGIDAHQDVDHDINYSVNTTEAMFNAFRAYRIKSKSRISGIIAGCVDQYLRRRKK